MGGEEGVKEAPRLLQLREAVEAISNHRAQMLCKVLYLTAARVSECLTKAGKYDRENKATKRARRWTKRNWAF